MKIFYVSLLLTLFCVVFTGCRSNIVLPKENITCEQAICLAKEAVQNKYGDRFDGYSAYAELEYDDEYHLNLWHVEFYLPRATESEEDIFVGGGYPFVKIDPLTGKIIYCLLQK